MKFGEVILISNDNQKAWRQKYFGRSIGNFEV